MEQTQVAAYTEIEGRPPPAMRNYILFPLLLLPFMIALAGCQATSVGRRLWG